MRLYAVGLKIFCSGALGVLQRSYYCFFAAVSAVFQFFGQPIACPGSSNDVVAGYCRKYGVYSSRGLPVDDSSFAFHWVTFYFLQQAFTLYLPRLLWRKVEGKTVERLILASKSGELLRCFNDTSDTQHRVYWIKFIICQMYNILGAIANVVAFFYIAYDYSFLLPYEIVCSFSSQKDTTCYIPGNIANQLFIIIALYWNAILSVAGLLHLIVQAIFAASPFVRNAFLHHTFKPLNEEDLKQVVYSEDWTTLFFVEQVARNLDHEEFEKFISDLAADRKRETNNEP